MRHAHARALRMAFSVCLLSLAAAAPRLQAQKPDVAAAPNYDLAAQWTPQKVGKLVFDTTVTPRWLESSDRFWYAYQTREGRRFMLVDPVKRTKAPLFDHAKMAATLTSITRIPYDAQHLPFSSGRFVKKDTAFEFDVAVPIDAVIAAPARRETTDQQGAAGARVPVRQQDDEFEPQQRAGAGAGPAPPARPKTRTLHFEYDLATAAVRYLDDYRDDQRPPRWASISPDGQTVVFARKDNLFMMDAANYAKAVKQADDSTIVEVQLTTDGVEHYSYARTAREIQQQREQEQQQQQDQRDEGEIVQQDTEREFIDKTGRGPSIPIVWSRDSNKFAVVRRDQRNVADLWVINALATPRPTLESYRYAMPGEKNAPQSELLVFDRATKARLVVKDDRFKDQTLSIATQPPRTNVQRDPRRPVPAEWLSDSPRKLYFTRVSRDQHRLDVVVADTTTGEARTLVEERLNTYVESKPLRLATNGTELVFWSERDGWGHFYLYDAETGALKNRITEGEFVTTGIDGIDDKARVLYISAGGREKGEDPVLHAPLSRRIRRVGHEAAHARRRDDGGVGDRLGEILRGQRLARGRPAEVRALRHARQSRPRSRDARSHGARGRRFQVSGTVHGQGRRWHHGLVRRDVQAVRLRSEAEISHHRLRLSGSADRERDQELQPAQQQHLARAVRIHRHRGRQSRRQPAAVEVVPQLRLRQSARLRTGRQEGGDRAAGEAPLVRGHHTRRNLGPFRRRLHERRRDARLPRLLQGGAGPNQATTRTTSTTTRGARSITV